MKSQDLPEAVEEDEQDVTEPDHVEPETTTETDEPVGSVLKLHYKNFNESVEIYASANNSDEAVRLFIFAFDTYKAELKNKQRTEKNPLSQ